MLQVVDSMGIRKMNVAVMVKGFLSFAAEKLREDDGFRAAKVRKPCSELNRSRKVGL